MLTHIDRYTGGVPFHNFCIVLKEIYGLVDNWVLNRTSNIDCVYNLFYFIQKAATLVNSSLPVHMTNIVKLFIALLSYNFVCMDREKSKLY